MLPFSLPTVRICPSFVHSSPDNIPYSLSNSKWASRMPMACSVYQPAPRWPSWTRTLKFKRLLCTTISIKSMLTMRRTLYTHTALKKRPYSNREVCQEWMNWRMKHFFLELRIFYRVTARATNHRASYMKRPQPNTILAAWNQVA